jgi:hypothetical protein
MNQFTPSELAASSMLVSHKIMSAQSTSSSSFDWSKIMKHIAPSDPFNPTGPVNILNINSACNSLNYSEEGLKSCIKCLYTLNTSIQSSQLKAITRKYKRARYFEVARLAAKFQVSSSTNAVGGGSNAAGAGN